MPLTRFQPCSLRTPLWHLFSVNLLVGATNWWIKNVRTHLRTHRKPIIILAVKHKYAIARVARQQGILKRVANLQSKSMQVYTRSVCRNWVCCVGSLGNQSISRPKPQRRNPIAVTLHEKQCYGTCALSRQSHIIWAKVPYNAQASPTPRNAGLSEFLWNLYFHSYIPNSFCELKGSKEWHVHWSIAVEISRTVGWVLANQACEHSLPSRHEHFADTYSKITSQLVLS